MFRRIFAVSRGSRHLTSKTMVSSGGIKTFVFMDLETTGLPQMENNTTKITEMCMVAVQADHIELGVFPRVHNKLSFCFNPSKMIDPMATDITGLSNELLQNQARFSSETVAAINCFLNMNRKPVCFVAHNGNYFDFPIMRTEINKTGSSLDDSILCLDSLPAFRHLEAEAVENRQHREAEPSIPFELQDGYDELLSKVCDELEEAETKKMTPGEVQKINETTPKKQMISSQGTSSGIRAKSKNLFNRSGFVSYKLVEVYKRLTNKEPTMEHQAEGDVSMLILCAATFAENFVRYANNTARKFNEVSAMRPGHRIGT